MRRENLTRMVSLMVVFIVALVTCRRISAQTVLKPLQPRTGQSSNTSLQPLIQRGAGQGVIVGYVYWDGNTIHHLPPNKCDGLSVTVRTEASSILIGASGFSYIPNIGTDGVCAYAVHEVPVEQDLQVQIDVTTPAAFSPASRPAVAVSSIKIIGGKCNNLPHAVPSLSDLGSGWWTCGDYAYNVNFILTASSVRNFSPVAGPVRVAPGTPVEQRMLANNNGQNRDTLLSPTRTTLLQQNQVGNIEPTQTLSAAGTAPGGVTSSTATPAGPMLAAPVAMQPNSTAPSRQQLVGGARPSGNINRRAALPANTTRVCLNKAVITAVNGKEAPQVPFVGGMVPGGVVAAVGVDAGVAFTPGNHYIISGCGFGTTPGKIYLLGQFPAHGGEIILGPYHAFGTPLGWGSHWSDQQIDAEIDPSLSGEAFQKGITLVIETSTGAKLQAYGFSFSP